MTPQGKLDKREMGSIQKILEGTRPVSDMKVRALREADDLAAPDADDVDAIVGQGPSGEGWDNQLPPPEEGEDDLPGAGEDDLLPPEEDEEEMPPEPEAEPVAGPTMTGQWVDATIGTVMSSLNVPEAEQTRVREAVWSAIVSGNLGAGKGVSTEMEMAISDMITQLVQQSTAQPEIEEEPEIELPDVPEDDAGAEESEDEEEEEEDEEESEEAGEEEDEEEDEEEEEEEEKPKGESRRPRGARGPMIPERAEKPRTLAERAFDLVWEDKIDEAIDLYVEEAIRKARQRAKRG